MKELFWKQLRKLEIKEFNKKEKGEKENGAVYEIRWHSSYRIVLSHEGSEMATLRAIVGSVETIRRIKHGWK